MCVEKSFPIHCKCETVKTLVTRLKTHSKRFEKLNFFKKSIPWFMEKCSQTISIYEKITNHRPFMQVSVRMELQEKCMISIFLYMKNV